VSGVSSTVAGIDVDARGLQTSNVAVCETAAPRWANPPRAAGNSSLRGYRRG
jgi:hypothetical protein